MENNDNISRTIYNFGELLAEKLQDMGVNASADDGLTTLADKINDVPSREYIDHTLYVIYDDNEDEYGSRPEQTPFVLKCFGEVMGGCLLPQNANGTINVDNYENIPSYTVKLPKYDLDNNIMNYQWEICDIDKLDKYTVQVLENSNGRYGLLLHEKPKQIGVPYSILLYTGSYETSQYIMNYADGYVLDELDNGIENVQVTLTTDDGLITKTVRTGKCGMFNSSFQAPKSYKNKVIASCGDLIRTSKVSDRKWRGKQLIYTNISASWENNTLTAQVNAGYAGELDEWQVEMYNIDGEFVTTLNKANPTYVAETPFSVRLEYKGDCIKGFLSSSLELDPPLIPTELTLKSTMGVAIENTGNQKTFECDLWLSKKSFESTGTLPNETILLYINDTLSENKETDSDGHVHFDEHRGSNKYEFRYVGNSNCYPSNYIVDLS